jgi:hypothetical protein
MAEEREGRRIRGSGRLEAEGAPELSKTARAAAAAHPSLSEEIPESAEGEEAGPVPSEVEQRALDMGMTTRKKQIEAAHPQKVQSDVNKHTDRGIRKAESGAKRAVASGAETAANFARGTVSGSPEPGAETKRRNFETANTRYQKPANLPGAGVRQQGGSRKAAVNRVVGDKSRLSQRVQARSQHLKQQARERIRGRMDMDEGGSPDLDALTLVLVLLAFLVAIIADGLQILLTLTGIGLIFCPFIGFAAGIIVGYLWICIGSNDFGGAMRKVGKRALLTLGAESILEFLPCLTLECLLNYLDLRGAFDNAAGEKIKQVIS